jgi:hypothetical protein
MPSNKDLINEANNLADELGLAVQTDGLKNDGLVDLVSDLRAKKRDAELETQADNEPKSPNPDDVEGPEQDPEQSGPVVADGRSVVTKRGVIGPGQSIRASDLSGGAESLQKLIKNGAVKG